MTAGQIENLGDIIAGKIPGRKSENEIIIFGMGGLPVYDVAWAKECYDKAVELGLGVKLNLWEEPYMH